MGTMDRLNLATTALSTASMNNEMRRQRKDREKAARAAYGPPIEVAARIDGALPAPLVMYACACGALVVDTAAHDEHHRRLA